MSTATIKYLGDLHTECTHNASGSIVFTDAPVDNNGKGANFSPTDLCAMSLGACALTIMGMYAQNNGLNIEGTTVNVTKTMGIGPRRISKIKIVFNMAPQAYTAEDKKALKGVFDTCPVCYSLHPDIEKDIQFIWS